MQDIVYIQLILYYYLWLSIFRAFLDKALLVCCNNVNHFIP